MLGLAVFSLVMLRSIVRSGPGENSTPVTKPSLLLNPDESPEAELDRDSSEPPRQRLKLRKPHSLKEDLAEIVREDPDAAATILRNWINNAG
jgi:flagellar M-ring protein FliF